MKIHLPVSQKLLAQAKACQRMIQLENEELHRFSDMEQQYLEMRLQFVEGHNFKVRLIDGMFMS